MKIIDSLNETKQMIDALLENKSLTFASNSIPKPLDETRNAAQACYFALQRGNKIIFMGNGGSAAEAQHLAAELVGHFIQDRKPYAAIALTTDTSAITAIGNDYSFKEIFSRQLLAIANRGDVAIYFSTSGSSENIIEAMKIGKTMGLVNVAFTGMKTSWMKEYAHYYIAVPSTKTPQIQEGHLMLGHILCDYIEEKMIRLENEIQTENLPNVWYGS